MKTLLALSISLVTTFSILGCSDNPETATNDTVQSDAKSAIAKRVSVDEWIKLMNANDGVVLDVRTAGEFQGGHIEGAVNMDFMESNFSDKLASLDKEKTYFMHCASGGRSAKALNAMRDMGFVAVYELEGGIRAYTAAGKSLVQ